MTAFACYRCCDVGVVECHQGSLKVLALCFCSQGKRQAWNLPAIPIPDFKDLALDWREYKPKNKIHQNEIQAWHLARIKTSEEFWASQAKAEPDSAS